LEDQSRQTETLRGLTRTIHSDRRVTPVLLPIGDGLMLARKRGLAVPPADPAAF
jgi:predicted O-methyltransferase YrrM